MNQKLIVMEKKVINWEVSIAPNRSFRDPVLRACISPHLKATFSPENVEVIELEDSILPEQGRKVMMIAFLTRAQEVIPVALEEIVFSKRQKDYLRKYFFNLYKFINNS